MVRECAGQCGFGDLAARDLRRTFAKLAHKGGAGLDQIQLSLGHASIRTTERYLMSRKLYVRRHMPSVSSAAAVSRKMRSSGTLPEGFDRHRTTVERPNFG